MKEKVENPILGAEFIFKGTMGLDVPFFLLVPSKHYTLELNTVLQSLSRQESSVITFWVGLH